MWFFGKDKEKNKNKQDVAKAGPATPLTSKQAKTEALMAQMRSLRAEIGEENLQELVKKLKLDELKNKIRNDIDNDTHKRDRLLDELRFQIHDADRPTRH